MVAVQLGNYCKGFTKLLTIFLSILLLLLGTILLILWLSLRPHSPTFHIIDFTVPGLAQPSGLNDSRITFNVTARNTNKHNGIYYDSVAGLVFYKDQQIGWTPLMEPFLQGPKTTTMLYGKFCGVKLTVTGKRWPEFINARKQGKVVFRLQITSVIKYKIRTWDAMHHKMHVNCDVGVGPKGSILPAWKNRKCHAHFARTLNGVEPDKVYGLFLCRGDVKPDLYKSCIIQQALRSETSVPRFEDLTKMISNVSNHMYATKQVNVWSSMMLYGLVQCTPDLLVADCLSCLRRAIAQLPKASAWKLWSEGQGMKLIDPLIVESCVVTQTISLPQPTELVGRVVLEPNQPSSYARVCSVNEVTISNLSPR
ncbi:hypothetical protein Golob_006797 [Gossypium lobatum]|uniref:Late embryogenesis abundant protein LEA-2 subgroup domain-containing protein n=1 Tax=Gossypium lobatum TaxID=34289 RepID=A0A7J8MXC0_9ROSI|nr:hypothetical protein [Gossypium lobatum]